MDAVLYEKRLDTGTAAEVAEDFTLPDYRPEIRRVAGIRGEAAIDGKYRTSEDFAAFLKDCGRNGRDDLVFVIGGSLGLSPKVLKRADEMLSFSPMTFPHQLMRIMLMEQISNCI